MGIHNLYCVNLNDTADVVLPGIVTQNVRTGTEYLAEATSGSIYPEHVAITGQKPSADYSTYCLAAHLAEIGITGLSIGDLATGLEMFAYLHLDGGGRSPGSTHRKYSIVKGLVVPRRITCDHRGDAQLFYEVFPVWNGSVDPIVITDTSAVPTAEDDNQRYTIGKATIGAIVLGDIRSWELDFGITVETNGGDSDIFDTMVSIVECKPVLTIKGVDVEWLKSTAIPLAGKAATQANTTVYLRKRIEGAGFVADATAQHIKINMAGLAWVEDMFAMGGRGAAECSVKLAAKFDGTNAPVVINTASAIT
jgi:hypothetical protein